MQRALKVSCHERRTFETSNSVEGNTLTKTKKTQKLIG